MKDSSHFPDFTRRGAEIRFRELVEEAKRLVAAFPHLRDSFDPDELPVRFIIEEGARQAGPAAKRRRTMSAAARQAISAAQKNRGAARRRGEHK